MEDTAFKENVVVLGNFCHKKEKEDGGQELQ